MYIVRIIGGLGNQMFQYAFSNSLKSLGHTVKIDIQEYDKYKPHNGFELNTLFNLNYIEASKRERENIGDCSRTLYSKFRKKIFGQKKTVYIEKNMAYDEEIFNLEGDKYFYGFWLNEKYFKHLRKQLLQDFTFKLPLDSKSLEVKEEIAKTMSVGVHVRRGDYIGQEIFDVCDKKYYLNAMNYFKTETKDVRFFIFSDDIEWCQNAFKNLPCFFVYWNKGQDSYKDMQLMSLCKHNIIANSTFSWWAAWLNNNPEKIVIAPNKWFNGNEVDYSGVVPDAWIKIDTSKLL